MACCKYHTQGLPHPHQLIMILILSYSHVKFYIKVQNLMLLRPEAVQLFEQPLFGWNPTDSALLIVLASSTV